LQNTGFSIAEAGAVFDELTTAPPTDDYNPTEFEFKKGMILFNRVVGHKPEMERFAKLMVEDVTETLPKDLPVIDSGSSSLRALLHGARPKAAEDADQKSKAESGANKQAPADQELLQGAWAIVRSVERDREEPGITGGIEVAGDKLTMTSALGGTEFKMAIDAAKQPKWMDLTFVKETTPSLFKNEDSFKGVFQIEGNVMTILLGPADKERPTDLAAKPGEGQFLIVLRRLTPAK
jgi:uncharacterized protein (TIGR03067 family)